MQQPTFYEILSNSLADVIPVENYSTIGEVIVCIYWVLVSSIKMKGSGSAISNP